MAEDAVPVAFALFPTAIESVWFAVEFAPKAVAFVTAKDFAPTATAFSPLPLARYPTATAFLPADAKEPTAVAPSSIVEDVAPTARESVPTVSPLKTQSSACADDAASRPPIIAACTIASLRADEERLLFDFDVSDAATHVPEVSFQTALKILFMKEGCLTI